jgi:hypothetical protein
LKLDIRRIKTLRLPIFVPPQKAGLSSTTTKKAGLSFTTKFPAMHSRLYLNAIIFLFICVTLPLWALPVYDDPVMARELALEYSLDARDVVPQFESLEERFFGLLGVIGRVAGTAARAGSKAA